MAEEKSGYPDEMRPGEVRLERTYRLELRVGERMMLRFGWGDVKSSLETPAELVGYGHYEFMLVRVQPSPGLLPHLAQGERVHVRFLSEGMAAIFQTEVLSHLTRPGIVISLAYPHVMNTVQVRKHKRLACALPVAAECDGASLPGIISDISRGGCRMILDIRGQSRAKSLALGDALRLRAPLALDKPLEPIEATVKNVETEQHRLIMGLAFGPMPAKTAQMLGTFLANTEILLD